MIIKKVEWISEDAKEAILYVGEDSFECIAFCHPCHLMEGDTLNQPLLTMDAVGIMKVTDEAQLHISRHGDTFAHSAVCIVTDLKNKMVCVGSIQIELDLPFSGNICSGDMIEFSCARIDAIC